MDIDPHLIEEIRSGNCVAFVGAGFAAPAVPNWDDLLRRISDKDEVREETKKRVDSLLNQSEREAPRGVFDREAAAQILEDELKAKFGKSKFGELVEEVVQDVSEKGRQQFKERERLLLGIPFESILTTNFDDLLKGEPGNDNAYREILRNPRARWFSEALWNLNGSRNTASILKLHGQIGETDDTKKPILTRRDYRKLLFGEGSRYRNFLKGVLSTRTILFLGFSFSDTYLNLLRSEIVAMLEPTGKKPLAYAVLDDIDRQEISFLKEHEGIQALPYDTNGGSDYSGFDKYLEAIYNETAKERIIGRLLENKRLLWVDPAPYNNTYEKQVIDQATEMGCEIVEALSPDSALKELNEGCFDLVISHWGYRPDTCRSNGQYLLEEIRRQNFEVPIIIFADGEFAKANRPTALKLGAFEYCWTFSNLFAAIERLFTQPQWEGETSDF